MFLDRRIEFSDHPVILIDFIISKCCEMRCVGVRSNKGCEAMRNDVVSPCNCVYIMSH